jgi:hypothetical protein
MRSCGSCCWRQPASLTCFSRSLPPGCDRARRGILPINQAGALPRPRGRPQIHQRFGSRQKSPSFFEKKEARKRLPPALLRRDLIAQ